MHTLLQRIIASKLTVLFAGMTAGAVTAPLWARAARPLVRGLIKAGLIVQREILDVAATLREELEDITAETRHELGEAPARAGHDHEPHRAHAHEAAQT